MNFFTDQVPTIQQLHELQGKDGKSIRIIDTVAPEWEELAMAMGFPAHVIGTIREAQHSRCQGSYSSNTHPVVGGEKFCSSIVGESSGLPLSG